MDGDGTRDILLQNVFQLIEKASVTPGGDWFAMVASNLNHYFEDTPAADFAMKPESREYVRANLAEVGFKPADAEKASRTWRTGSSTRGTPGTWKIACSIRPSRRGSPARATT